VPSVRGASLALVWSNGEACETVRRGPTSRPHAFECAVEDIESVNSLCVSFSQPEGMSGWTKQNSYHFTDADITQPIEAPGLTNPDARGGTRVRGEERKDRNPEGEINDGRRRRTRSRPAAHCLEVGGSGEDYRRQDYHSLID
jgi:hypothetical protein